MHKPILIAANAAGEFTSALPTSLTQACAHPAGHLWGYMMGCDALPIFRLGEAFFKSFSNRYF
jgi:hypothetical protein